MAHSDDPIPSPQHHDEAPDADAATTTPVIRSPADVADHPRARPRDPHLATDDIANGEFFAAMHADRVLFDHTFRQWFLWDGRRWQADTCANIMELAKQTARQIEQQAEESPSRQARQRAARALSMNGLRAMLASAESLPQLSMTAERWDSDPMLFNLHNGTLDLTTGTVREHRPDDRLRMLAGCGFDPDARAPHFMRCLERYWPDEHGVDAGITDFLIVYLGYCLSGLNNEKMFLMLHGTGDTGKTTLMNAIRNVWGDYFKAADWSTFAHQRDGDLGRHRTDLVRLAGARIVSASEGDEGCRMSEGVIKRITGRTPMVIRDLHAKPFEFSPAYKIFFDTNHLPSFRGQDQAIWNRLKRIPFRNVFSRQEQHIFRQTYGDLDALLAAEASGILRLAMAGWQEYQQAGRIIVPKSIESATTMYQQNEDELGQFLEDRCTAGSDCSVEKSELYQQYTEWSKENGDVLVTAKRFGMMMMEKGYRDAKRGSTRYWLGLRVNMTRKERDLHMFANARPAF